MIHLEKDEIISHRGEEYFFIETDEDMTHVKIRHGKTNRVEYVSITDIGPAGEIKKAEDFTNLPLDAYTEKELAKARQRYSIIAPLLNPNREEDISYEVIAKKNNIAVSTLYNWIYRYGCGGNIGSLVDREGRGGKGKMRLELRVEEVVTEKLYEFYLNQKQKKSFNYTYEEIRKKCEALGIGIPHTNTVRKRIRAISDYEKNKRRIGPRTAAQQYEAKPGHLIVNTPLSLVQIDHTPLDVILVSEVDREPIGKPWLTLLIDICTRVVLGFYLSFDHPGAYGTGRAIAHAILPKELYLKSLGLDSEWPCWGIIKNIHCDNAKEFKGNMLKLSCMDYNMILDFRPPKYPQAGGHIERLMGTFSTEIHDLAGTTKVTREMWSKFKPEKAATMTLTELETWLALFVTEVYHKRLHTELDMAPIDRWKAGVRGYGNHPGIGVPARLTDESRLKLDLMPVIYRTVQRGGIEIDKIIYYGDVLRKWVNAVDHEAKGKKKPKRKFIFKQDPRDISKIYFLDPEAKMYFELPYLNISGPKMSKWDYKKVVRKLSEEKQVVDERSIFEGYRKMRELEESSRKKTKEVRKRNERENRQERESTIVITKSNATFSSPLFKISNDDIKPYDEIEHG